MVSLWPWKKDDSSPASFEKALSNLAIRITKATSRLETSRQRLRRFKALWTLYAGFTYILCLVILALVVGWRKWGIWEYTGISGGPVLIYLVRMGISAYYDYRISHQQSHVETLVKERESTIDRLKAATKYNTTQQLLEKYGGSVPKSTTKKSKPAHQNHNNQMNNRAPLVPPPTANIPSRQNPASLPSTPNRSAPVPSPLGASPLASVNAAFSGGSQQNPQIPSPRPQSPNAEFAPNAFSGAYSFQSNSDAEPRWYDRIMDVLLGEDESHPRNRIVLICELCRLVNGQAPPGVKKLEDVGKWRCVGCGTMNGVDKESEARKIIKDVRREVAEEGGEEAGKGGATGTGRNRKKHSSSSVAGGQIDGEDGAEEMKLAADDSESDVTVYTDDGNEITEEVKAENQTHSKKAETPPPEPKMTRRRAKEKAESK